MSEDTRVRYGWLRFMYAYTIIGAGAMGLALIVAPSAVISAFRWPEQDPVVMGVTASVYLAFGVLSVFGLRDPLKFAPVLCLQLFYKCLWMIGIVLPLVAVGQLPAHGLVFAAIFATYIIGDLIAIPFARIFRSEAVPAHPEEA